MSFVEYITNDALLCEWDSAPYLLFSGEVEPLVYYSHLFPAIAVVILAIVILRKNARSLTSKLFAIVGLLFALFAVFDLILWATEQPSLIMFLWSLLTYIEPLIYAVMLYLVLIYAYQKDVSLWSKVTVGVLLLPIILLGPTEMNLAAFDYTNCWRLAVEGPLLYYVYIFEVVLVGWMIVGASHAIRISNDPVHRRTTTYLLIGSLLFLLAFSSGNVIGTLLQGVMGEEAWVIGQYGLFGMPLFLGFILYLMVRFEMFAARMLYAEALMLGVFVALLSLLLIPDIQTARPIIMITVVLVGFLGYLLVIGIRNDVKQREEIEGLAKKLEQANKRLKALDKLKSEFVSIASHQLRSPLTSIRGYAAMLVEGSFGKIPQKAEEPLRRIEISAHNMALSIEDYLNVSRIESGNMKYDYSDFNLKDLAESITDDIRPQAIKKGLVMSFKSDVTSKGIVHADQGKVQQILHNLINNALKYTPKGTITVFAHDDKKAKKMYIEIIDSGVGMIPDTIEHLFDKFERAQNASRVNAGGAGLGLFVARSMARAMKGDVTGHSKGEGEGSHFILELPLSM